MPRFTKKPVTIDAIQFTGSNLFDCLRFMGESQDVLDNLELKATDAPIIRTLEGLMTTSPGDWIIKGVKGEFYPCKPDIFELTYEPGDGMQVITLKGDVPPEQFAEFRRKWDAEVRSTSRAIIVDAEPNGDLLDAAWGLIANAGGGNWSLETPEWQEAAKRWRTEYHKTFPDAHDGTLDTAIEGANLMARAWNEKVARINAQEKAAVESGWVELKDQPPPKKREDLKPTWEVVHEEFRDRYVKPDLSSTELRVIHDVLDDMIARDATGRERYGVPLTAYNGRDQLVDAYQEALDLAVYLRSAMEEGQPVSAVYSNALHNIFWLRVTINGRAVRSA